MIDLSTILPLAAEAAAEEESSSFLVSPSIGLMIWTLVVFAAVLAILKKWAIPPIQKAIDDRRALIEDSINHAEQTRKEADLLLADYRQRLTEARSQADDIVARARKAADQREADALEAGRKEREELLEQTKKEIQLETEKSLQDLRREVASLTVLATEKVTRKSLDSADQQRLVEEALGEVDFSALTGGASKN
ncbi:MAG: F0F1 ATP synthase subunit B [Actinobacteria bacterium]|nr:F0F1 ATP synthase subunit B [Actinomycetota bacterium]